MKNLVRFMLLVFLIVPLGMALYLFRSAEELDASAETILGDQGGFSESSPFVAEGQLWSASGQSLTSMHQEKSCLAYRIKFDLRHTVTDSDGEDEDRTVELFEERHQVPDLEVKFEKGKALLDIQTVKEFYQPYFEELDELPEYVPYERIPKVKTDRFWFEVFETLFLPDRTYTVAAQANSLGLLEAHPKIGHILVFPGTKQECALALGKQGSRYRTLAFIMIGVSLMGVFLSGLALRVMSD